MLIFFSSGLGANQSELIKPSFDSSSSVFSFPHNQQINEIYWRNEVLTTVIVKLQL